MNTWPFGVQRNATCDRLIPLSAKRRGFRCRAPTGLRTTTWAGFSVVVCCDLNIARCALVNRHIPGGFEAYVSQSYHNPFRFRRDRQATRVASDVVRVSADLELPIGFASFSPSLRL